jgi:predicted secreted hydrolase
MMLLPSTRRLHGLAARIFRVSRSTCGVSRSTCGVSRSTCHAARWLLLVAVAGGALLPACGSPAPRDAAVGASLELGELLGGADTLHERAREPRAFTFPADHGPHPEFRTEWWYFTGNITADDGHELGYQLTFFRSALTDSASFAQRDDALHTAGGNTADGARSDWRSRHAYMAHFAVSDISARRFHYAQRFSRAAVGLAGAEAAPFRVWLEDWSAAGDFFPLRVRAADADVSIDLVLAEGKPMVLQGERGLSRKGPEPGNASYYYSFTRMPTSGTVRIGGRTHQVTGNSWLDREWSTSALSDDLQGWDWMALQFADSTELMLYRLRRHDGTAGPFSAGTFVAADGSTTHLAATDFTMRPARSWRSPVDGTPYPTDWQVDVPRLEMSLAVTAAFDAQELDVAVRYWEGAVRMSGYRAGRQVSGRGYLEMTGYDAATAPAGPEPRR